ncbi:MAG: FAD-binding oxidoreductase [Deltaproteobacteria bacterium]|nr:FAD-binding oxidoreductase [Deltaproteobacteria bacterium]
MTTAPGVTPSDEHALGQIIAAANADQQPIRITGSGSKPHFGRTGSPAQVVHMGAFNRITEHPPGDLVVTAQAGVRLADLQAGLARHNQWLPVDPPFSDTTIGGMLATGLSGPRRLGYGQVKDHLLGMRVVGTTGVATESGGKVVKNVTGFDLHRLHTGAKGTLAVIVHAHFKIATRPECSRILVVKSDEPRRLVQFLMRVRGTKLQPTALELLGGTSLVGRCNSIGDIGRACAAAFVGVAGNPASVARHESDLSRVLREESLVANWLDGADANSGWQTIAQLPEHWRQRIVFRLGALPDSLSQRISQSLLCEGVECVASLGANTARIVLPEGTSVEVARSFLARHLDKHAPHEGYCVAESAPVDLPNRDDLPWFSSAHHHRSQAQLFRSVKNAYDPRGIFNPGKEPF